MENFIRIKVVNTFFVLVFLTFFFVAPCNAGELEIYPVAENQYQQSSVYDGFYTPLTISEPVNSSTGEFVPFQGYNNDFQGPILYGPGGDPIGGLPVDDGNLILVLLVFIYSIYQLVKRYYLLKK